MNKNNLELLNKFANVNPLAHEVDVRITEHYTSFTTKISDQGAKYEEVVLLSSLIQGATHFIYFLERNGYKIIKDV